MKLSEIKSNPANPRIIRDAKFEQLKKSIQDFPAMMELRPMIIDRDGIVLGGNMRLRALQELGYTEVPNNWVKRAEELTEDEKRRFIIADNVGYGDWDWDTLANAWDAGELQEWGLDVPGFDNLAGEINYSDKNKEIDVDELGAQMTINLKYTEEEYWQVKEGLNKIAQTPEQAVWKLLGYE